MSNIFKYFDGQNEVHGDPTAIERKLRLATGGRFYDILRATQKPKDYKGWLDEIADEKTPEERRAGLLQSVRDANLAADQAAEEITPAIRAAFEMVPFDKTTGQGATDDHCIDAWNAFTAFREQKKSSGEKEPKSATSMGSAPSPNTEIPLAPIKPGQYPNKIRQGIIKFVPAPPVLSTASA
jgi:hypothetical protein